MKTWPRGDLRRLLTSRAHRLGKPHRTFGPLTPSVTRWSRRRALRTLASAPCSKLHGPPRQVSTLAAFPLRTTAQPWPGRLPLVRSSCLAAEADLRALPLFEFARARPAPFHPPRIDPRRQRETATGGCPARHRSFSYAPARPPPCGFELPGASLPCGAQWERCVLPASATDYTTRALHGPRDSRRAPASSKAPLDGGPPASVRMSTWPRSPGGPASLGLVDLKARDREPCRAALPLLRPAACSAGAGVPSCF